MGGCVKHWADKRGKVARLKYKSFVTSLATADRRMAVKDKKAYRPFAEKRDKVGMDDVPYTGIRNACNLVNLLWEYVFGFLNQK